MKTYDAKQVNVIVSGRFLTGFAEGTFVNCEKDEERFETYVGAKGELSRSVNSDPLGTITVTLKSDSLSNGYLASLATSSNTFPVQVLDSNSGGFKAGGNDCWIEKAAAKEFDVAVNEREWVIKVGDYDQRES